jgi:hypothetical protein
MKEYLKQYSKGNLSAKKGYVETTDVFVFNIAGQNFKGKLLNI